MTMKSPGSVIQLNCNIQMDSWTFNAHNEITQGYNVTNSGQGILYYVWYNKLGTHAN